MRIDAAKCLTVGLTLFLSACGGGGSPVATVASTPPPTPTPTPTPVPVPAPTPPLTNLAAIVVDYGPASINTGPKPYVASDTVFVSVTVCAPGTSTCQTVDHVQIDTGSVGLRLFPSVLSAAVLGALPHENAATGNPVAECYGFVDGYVFGGVRTADVTVGGEKVAAMPFHLISDPDIPAVVPASCSKGGGTNINTVAALGSNGIYGVGVTLTDCGAACARGSFSAAIYYDCPTAGCTQVISRASNSTAPFEQVPNPVGALAVDNNGLIISLPAVAPAGAQSASGTMFFGIGTQTNNGLGAATVLATSNSSSRTGAGFITATYKGQTLSSSYIDSGSNAYYFVDTLIPTCTASGFKGYYCPTARLSLSASLLAADGSSVAAPFFIYNAQNLFSSINAALPALGANPNLLSNLSPVSNSFDFGLPFFFGRNIYVAFEGRTAGGTAGPYFAY